MTKEEFNNLLNSSSHQCVEFTQKFLIDKLSSEFRFDVYLNMSFDENSHSFHRFHEDDNRIEINLNQNQVCKLLLRKGKIPVWIDISVYKTNSKSTTFKLICSGRYTDIHTELYYHQRDTGPFAIKSPVLPTNHQKGTKFYLIDEKKPFHKKVIQHIIRFVKNTFLT